MQSVLGQYVLIGCAVLVLLGIKYYSVNKSYSNQLSHFVHPLSLVPQVRKKLKKFPDSDPRKILAKSLTDLKEDPGRMRNISILICLMKEDKINLDPFHNRIKQELASVDYEKTADYIRRYRDFILNEITTNA